MLALLVTLALLAPAQTPVTSPLAQWPGLGTPFWRCKRAIVPGTDQVGTLCVCRHAECRNVPLKEIEKENG